MAPPVLDDIHAVAMLDRPLELPQSLPELATRAMQRFRCVASACEDSCCHDFGINIDRPSLDRLRSAVAHDPVTREKVVRLVVLGMRTPGREAPPNMVQLDDHGGCPLLDPDGGCGVHRRHGEALLSTTCSVFPRTSLAVEQRLEVTGSLACPELARLSLLAEDGLDQDSPIDPVLPRAYVGKSVETDAGGLYLSAFTRTRETLSDLFRQEEFPVGARFAFAATLAAEVDEYFRRDAAATGAAEGYLLRRRLEVELDASGSGDNLAALNADLAGLPETPAAVVASVVGLLAGRMRLTHSPRFGALVQSAFASLDVDADTARTVAALRARRTALEALAPGLMDRLLGRYARHYLLRNPYTERPSLMAYLSRLGTDLAALRFLWLGASRLDAFVQGTPDTSDAAEGAVAARAITEAGIEVIQAYTKAVSHNVDFLNAVHEAEQQPGKPRENVRFGSLILLARFI